MAPLASPSRLRLNHVAAHRIRVPLVAATPRISLPKTTLSFFGASNPSPGSILTIFGYHSLARGNDLLVGPFRQVGRFRCIDGYLILPSLGLDNFVGRWSRWRFCDGRGPAGHFAGKQNCKHSHSEVDRTTSAEE